MINRPYRIYSSKCGANRIKKNIRLRKIDFLIKEKNDLFHSLTGSLTLIIRINTLWKNPLLMWWENDENLNIYLNQFWANYSISEVYGKVNNLHYFFYYCFRFVHFHSRKVVKSYFFSTFFFFNLILTLKNNFLFLHMIQLPFQIDPFKFSM